MTDTLISDPTIDCDPNNFDINFNISSPYLSVKDFNNIRHVNHKQSWAVSPIQYILRQYIYLRQKISIVDTFVFVFVSIIKIIKVFVIVSISHK